MFWFTIYSFGKEEIEPAMQGTARSSPLYSSTPVPRPRGKKLPRSQHPQPEPPQRKENTDRAELPALLTVLFHNTEPKTSQTHCIGVVETGSRAEVARKL